MKGNLIVREIEVYEVAVGQFEDQESGKVINYRNLKENYMGGVATPSYKISPSLSEKMVNELKYGDQVRISLPLKMYKDKWVLGEIVAYEKIEDKK